jgi:acyl dehydratase
MPLPAPYAAVLTRMPVNLDAIGKQWPPASYEVGLEKIREYARAVGETNPVHLDREAALAAGFRDVVAPPMFCVVYSAPAMGPAVLDPEVGIDLAAMVHGGQEFVWGEPVCAGDTITTEASVKEIYEKDGKGFYVFESVSKNQDGDQVVRATWTNIVRGV